MEAFWQGKQTRIFNGLAYMFAWEKKLGFIPTAQEMDSKKRAALINHLAQNVAALWKRFNAERDDLDRDYMSEPKYFKPYLASFHLPNIERMFCILSSRDVAPAVQKVIENINDGTLMVCDFGCGPLAATAALLSHLAETQLKKPLKVIVEAIDRARESIVVGEELLNAAVRAGIELEIRPLTSIDKSTLPRHDITLAANVLNEVPERIRYKLLKTLMGKCGSHSLFIAMEPAQDIHSKALISLRDQVVAESRAWQVLSPCLHNGSCPMQGSDWCWFQTTWASPILIDSLDRITSLKHRTLNFSFVAFAKGIKAEKVLDKGRVVSEPISLGKTTDANAAKFLGWVKANDLRIFNKITALGQTQPLTKYLVCASTGEIINSIHGGSVEVGRGDVVDLPGDGICIAAKARQQKPGKESEGKGRRGLRPV